jgi:hypothetical protein
MPRIRRYTDMNRMYTFEERFDYLNLLGQVGSSTFGFDRHLNQRFYRSREWKHIRDFVIVRDNGCDLWIECYEIHDKMLIHHINPMDIDDVVEGDERILDPQYLITTTHRTHNAIHFGDARSLPRPFVERSRGDTKLW